MASPTWHSGGALNTWITLPNSDLNASGVMQSGGMEVVDAWGGGVVVTLGLYIGSTFTTGTFLVVWGGGHTNYSGNEVYAYGPLENNSPTWNRLRDRTSPAPTDVSTDGSGNPVSRHTYNTLSYVNDGTRNWMVSLGCLFSYIASNGYTDVYVYDFAQVSPNSNLPWSLKTPANGAAQVSAYEPSSGKIWYHLYTENKVGSYHVATDTHDEEWYKSPTDGAGNPTSCIDTALGIWAIYDGSAGLSFYRTNNGVSNDWYAPSTTGTAPTGQGSILYDPVAAVFRVWVGGGKTIWTLTPPGTSPYQGGNNWTWSSATAGSGSTPDTQNAQGTFGRFGYSPNADVVGYILMNNPDGNIYFYKSGASVAGAAAGNAGFRSLLGVGK